MEKANVKTYRESSDAAHVYRDSSGMNVASFNSSATIGNYADMMKDSVVLVSEISLVEPEMVPVVIYDMNEG